MNVLQHEIKWVKHHLVEKSSRTTLINMYINNLYHIRFVYIHKQPTPFRMYNINWKEWNTKTCLDKIRPMGPNWNIPSMWKSFTNECCDWEYTLSMRGKSVYYRPGFKMWWIKLEYKCMWTIIAGSVALGHDNLFKAKHA